ncbi:hypothetical protein HUN08_04255 [Gordonia sp. X0973]|uniref:lipase family protein n=1 Tax=Gordonia sp. X0973 TaxID=2742602 RepID=UPI000F51E30D|nr:lipase family protein [Gordonia sp. X0973]QKT06487.1 hypothetical protein HUN08_04255 [Gordonia sp. X0973]
MRSHSLVLGAALTASALTLTTAVSASPATAAPATGAVLGQSAVAAANLPSGAARGVKLLYTTRDQNGRAAQTTGVVYYPRAPKPAGGWKVVSWAHGTSGIAPQCAPSRATRAVQDQSQPNISAALRRGYVVTASDYIGLGGGGTTEYLGGRSAAYNVIDMVRAARNLDPTIGKRWASLGHSQGGHAALWAARMAPRYAPDLPMVGAVALAPASQIPATMSLLQRPELPSLGQLNMTSLFGLYVMAGMDRVYPNLGVKNYLTPAGRYWLARVSKVCAQAGAAALSNVAPGTLYAKATGASPRFMAALRAYSDIPASGFRSPVRLQQGLTDTIVFPVNTSELQGQLRVGGVDVTTGWYPGGHMAVARESMENTMATVDGYFR